MCTCRKGVSVVAHWKDNCDHVPNPNEHLCVCPCTNKLCGKHTSETCIPIYTKPDLRHLQLCTVKSIPVSTTNVLSPEMKSTVMCSHSDVIINGYTILIAASFLGTLRPWKMVAILPNNIFKLIFMNENCCALNLNEFCFQVSNQ